MPDRRGPNLEAPVAPIDGTVALRLPLPRSNEEVRARASDKLLLRGGSVVTMDAEIGDLPSGDVLIEGGKIAAVAPRIEATGRRGDRRHRPRRDRRASSTRTGTRGRRRSAAARPTPRLTTISSRCSTPSRPSTARRTSTRATWRARSSASTPGSPRWSTGRTSTTRPEHPDAAVRALRESGIRARYAYGSANLSLADYWNESRSQIPADDVRRVRDTYFGSGDGLLTMALATRGPGFCLTTSCGRSGGIARRARPAGHLHVAMGRLAGRFDMVARSTPWGCSGPAPPSSTACYLSDDEWR